MKRLVDDPQYAGELRADLLRSRSAGQDYQTAAKLLQLRAAFSDKPAARETGLKQVMRRWLHPGWKLAVLVALGGGAGLSAYSAPQPRARPTPPPLAAASPSPQPITSEVLQPTAASVAPPDEPARMVDSAAELAPRRGSDGSSSRREIAQLVRMRALLAQDPAAAYRLARRGEREFPRGILAEERQALAIVALAGTGAKELAHKQARRFFARYPQSPLRESVEAALQR